MKVSKTMLYRLLSAVITGAVTGLLFYFIRKGIVKKRETDQEKMDTALQIHDVNSLVKNNQDKRWINYESIKRDLALHQKWLDGDTEGKQISLFAEEIFNLAGFKGQRIVKAKFSHCLFNRVDLTGTQFVDCDLEYCLFKKCKLDGTDFTRSKVIDPKFDN